MKNLKDRRIALNMTQTELAEVFGVTGTTLAKWERGDSEPPAAGMLALALEALKTRQLLESLEFDKKSELVAARVSKTLNEAQQLGGERKRVKHSGKSVI